MRNKAFQTEKSVIDFMLLNGIKKLRLYYYAFVNECDYQQFGFSHKNINADYYFNQRVISTKTKSFSA